jgi:small GTP-binding protein
MSHFRSSFQIILLGENFVGKTSLVDTFVGKPSDLRINFLGQWRDIIIWDNSGDEKYHSLIPLYCRGACGAIIIYSVTDAHSFRAIPKWINFLRDSSPNAIIQVFGNKTDLIEHREVRTEEAFAFCERRGYSFFEGSALTGANVQAVFQYIIEGCCYRSDGIVPGRVTLGITLNVDSK